MYINDLDLAVVSDELYILSAVTSVSLCLRFSCV